MFFLSKFYRRLYALVLNLILGLQKTLLHEGLSKPEFYGDLVCKTFKKLAGRNDFSHQKNIPFRPMSNNLNVMRQSACLVKGLQEYKRPN